MMELLLCLDCSFVVGIYYRVYHVILYIKDTFFLPVDTNDDGACEIFFVRTSGFR